MDDHSQLQQEWRQIVLAKLDSLERGQKTVEDRLVQFTMASAKKEDVCALELRVRALEEIKIKALAAWAVIQAISVAIVWGISFLFK